MRNRLIFATIVLFAAYTLTSRADYTATQGTGTNFGSIVAGGIHYPQFNLCDPTTPARCVVVNASGQITTTLPTGAATSALQSTGNTTLTNIESALGGTLAIAGPVSIPANGFPDFSNTLTTVNAGAANATTAQAIGSQYDSTQKTLTNGQQAAFAMSARGATIVVPGVENFAVQAAPTPVTTGGLSWYFVQPTASDNHVVIKAGAGQVYNIQVTNNSATVNYLRLYNATTGFNGCNSATNIVGQWAIPASTSVGGLSISIPLGVAFSTGISICVTSGYATTDTTNATASAMSINVGYK